MQAWYVYIHFVSILLKMDDQAQLDFDTTMEELRSLVQLRKLVFNSRILATDSTQLRITYEQLGKTILNRIPQLGCVNVNGIEQKADGTDPVGATGNEWKDEKWWS